MKTVFMISPFARPNIGGVESHIEKLSSYLSETGQKVILVTYQPLISKAKGMAYEKRDGVEIYRMPWFGRGWFNRLEPYFPLVFIYLFPGLFLKSLLVYMKRHGEVDVIHAHGLVAAAVARLLVSIHGKRTVVSTHAIYRFGNRRLLAGIVRRLLKNFDVILAVGEPSRKELIAMGLDAGRIKVHPNWIDIKRFSVMDRKKCRHILNLDPEDFIVLFTGRLMEMKGVSVLLEAAMRTERDIRFVFAGDGPMAGTVKKAADGNDRVKFCGRLSDSDLVMAYNAADIFASPVLYDEGFATVYLEAIACGTPVVTAKRGCLPHFLSPDVADLLENVDADTVKNTLERYCDDRKSITKKRAVCREYALENFSEKNAEIIAASY